MKEFIPLLSASSLFSGIQAEEVAGLLGCLGAKKVRYKKNQSVFLEGDPAGYLGMVLSGSLQINRDDAYGNRDILGRVVAGEVFAESYAFADVAAMPVNVISQEDSQVLLIDSRRITRCCSNACSFHNQLIQNLLQIVAQKNLQFHEKLEITAKRTTREKLLAYLSAQEKRAGSKSFTIPFDRQALADYLGVERSAMSNEISKLRNEGILECNRSHFTLLT